MSEPRKTIPNAAESSSEEQSLSRRGFLKGVGAFVAVSSIPVVASGCAPQVAEQLGYSVTPGVPTALQYPEVPPPPAVLPDPGLLHFFTPQEARTVDALTARILPGTPDDPGAREAGVVTYLDNLLAHSDGYAEKVYRMPPYAESYEGDAPPETGDAFQVVWVPADQIKRYGYQSVLTPREVYRLGLAAVNNYARSTFGSVVAELDEQQQDQIVQDLLDGRADDFFDQFNGESFFHVLRRGVSEGMFSDPAYGGNRNMVGWKLIGYPGAQRAYLPDEIRAVDRAPRPPQSLAQMHEFSPGEDAGPSVILPVSGSAQQYPPPGPAYPSGDLPADLPMPGGHHE